MAAEQSRPLKKLESERIIGTLLLDPFMADRDLRNRFSEPLQRSEFLQSPEGKKALLKLRERRETVLQDRYFIELEFGPSDKYSYATKSFTVRFDSFAEAEKSIPDRKYNKENVLFKQLPIEQKRMWDDQDWITEVRVPTPPPVAVDIEESPIACRLAFDLNQTLAKSQVKGEGKMVEVPVIQPKNVEIQFYRRDNEKILYTKAF